MKIMIVTDAWEPQVNGVVRTLKQTCHELRLMGHEIEMITPDQFKTIPCPTYPGYFFIAISWERRSAQNQGF